MGDTVSFQLIFIFIYSTFNKKFSILTKYADEINAHTPPNFKLVTKTPLNFFIDQFTPEQLNYTHLSNF